MFRIHHRDVLVLFKEKKIIYSIPLYYPEEVSSNMNYMNLTIQPKGVPTIEYSFAHPSDFYKVPIAAEKPLIV
jgi:hypothetical protein